MPKKVKKSEFNVVGQDQLTEQMYGEGAVRLTDCRMVIRDGGFEYIGDRDKPEDMDKWIKKVGLFGVAVNVPNMVNGDGEFQMWDCDIILIPRKKYRRGLGANKGRADRVLCGGQIGNPECWEEEIFDRDDNGNSI